MQLNTIKEPELEFGRGRHICPRAGIAQHDVYDARFKARRDKVLVGAVGTSAGLDKLAQWIDRCTRVIPAKPDSKQPNLFPAFCGFNSEIGFRATMLLEDEITRSLKISDVRSLKKIKRHGALVDALLDLYYPQIRFLMQNRVVDVGIVVLPDDIYNKVAKVTKASVEEEVDDESAEIPFLENNFRRALKARAMHLGKPLQLVREGSLIDSTGRQDPASKAWNFCTALYYKANQTVPWKLAVSTSRLPTCFVGISFYRSRDKKVLNTSLAQLFDELGNSVILRGDPVILDKDDRRPHLSEQQAFELMQRALKEYEVALENNPARLVIHKSSNFNDAELTGFKAAISQQRIQRVDFVTILDTKVRLFRDGFYPTHRGTHLEFDDDHHLLYTRGSVPYYRTYTGMYVPHPLDIRIVEADESPSQICREILSLTKMNWNNTQFDGRLPITLQCARRVGEIMKYLRPEDGEPQTSYSFYM
jgi:hypothetical protein